MDTQTLLVIIIALLSANLIFVGIYIVLILKEVRAAITKINGILDSAEAVSSAVATPIVGASGAISAFSEGMKAFKIIRDLRGKKQKSEARKQKVENDDDE